MKKFMLLLCAALLVCAISPPALAAEGYSPDFEVNARAVYLYNLDTETLIWSNNADMPLAPASTTKIMTCILALENTPDLERETVVYPAYVQDYLYDYQYVQGNGAVSHAGLMAGEELSMKDALYALMLPSANEVAMTIADHIGGSQEEFVAMMNRRARELGATNTNFVNANGLYDDGHVTTAHDLYVMARHAMSLAGFMDIVTATSYSCPPTNIHESGLKWETTNQMMVQNSSHYYPSVKGIKTGALPQAGHCLVSTASRDGFTYMLVVLGATTTDADGKQIAGQAAFIESKKIYDWVFDTFRVKKLVERGRHVTEIPLRLNMDKDHIKLMTGDQFTSLLPKDIEASSVTLIPEIPDSVDAPVEKGDKIGEAVLILSGEEIGRVPLLAAESVSASQLLVTLEQVKNIMRSFWFKFAVVFIVLLILLYIVLMIVRNRNQRRRGYKPRRRL